VAGRVICRGTWAIAGTRRSGILWEGDIVDVDRGVPNETGYLEQLPVCERIEYALAFEREILDDPSILDHIPNGSSAPPPPA
jgi:hypothetical protein